MTAPSQGTLVLPLLLATLCAAAPGCDALDASATTPEPAWVTAAFSGLRDNAIEAGAATIDEGPDLDDRPLNAAAKNYAGLCINCHGAPGSEPGPLAAMHPSPPPLAAPPPGRGADREPEALFWVIRHGLSRTGMPPFADLFDENMTWSLAALVLELPSMSPERFQELVQTAGAPPTAGERSDRPLRD